jgi:hypothetical protein
VLQRHVAIAARHACGGWQAQWWGQGRCVAGATQRSLPSVVLAESFISVLFLEVHAISEMAGPERSMTRGCSSLSGIVERGGCIVTLGLLLPPVVVHADNNVELQSVMRWGSDRRA